MSPVSGPWPSGPEAPVENLEIYRVLFALETMLRELVIETMNAALGPMWYRDRLPPDCRDHFALGIGRDRETRWTSNVPHHPVYYLTFPDLRATIEAKSNWNSIFCHVFPKNKDLLITDLQELEFIRNKVAHNRRATRADVAIVNAAYEKLCNEIGLAHARKLAERYTIELNIPEHLVALRREADVAFALSVRGQALKKLDKWSDAQARWWWFDQNYLGHSLNRIRMYFETMHAYCQEAAVLNREDAGKISQARDLRVQHDNACSDLASILSNWEPASPIS